MFFFDKISGTRGTILRETDCLFFPHGRKKGTRILRQTIPGKLDVADYESNFQILPETAGVTRKDIKFLLGRSGPHRKYDIRRIPLVTMQRGEAKF